jgi:outer membrane protein insertion porin family
LKSRSSADKDACRVTHNRSRSRFVPRVALAVGLALSGASVLGQASSTVTRRDITATSDLLGRPVEGVRVEGNREASTASVLAAVRTREGEPYDPLTVQEDYQRIYNQRRFSNVTARVEPTATGVIVVFIVTEQRQIKGVEFRGNRNIPVEQLNGSIDLRPGEAIDGFRIAVARRSIETLYRSRNFSFAQVAINSKELEENARVVFEVTEGPRVYVRNINFVGLKSFDPDDLKDEIQTKTWFPLLRDGTYNPDTLDDDVAALRRYFERKGFFDAKVGRRLVFSPDMSELQVDFLVDEGPRYRVSRISFKGNTSLSEAELRTALRTREGDPFDGERVRRDVRELVRKYSPLGFIFEEQSNDPDYLRITPRTVFSMQPGEVEVVFDIAEGKPFRVGEILPRGNSRTQDKVVLRELKLAPGDVYNSGAVQDAEERLRGSPYFSSASITPVGDADGIRDLVVEVAEGQTAFFQVGAGINSNGGLGGNLTFTQRNFDIANWPDSWDDLVEGRALVGAGQSFRASLEPGTEVSNASIQWVEPWLFDQPYSLLLEGYLRTRDYDEYDQRSLGGRVSVTRRFRDVWSVTLSLRGEVVDIRDIDDPPARSIQILAEEGDHPMTSITASIRRNTVNRGIVLHTGSNLGFSWESVGLLAGDYQFQKLILSYDRYFTLSEDLLERRTVLAFRSSVGYIFDDAPFFERFYGGGLGSVRGFSFRGISPRDGPQDDAVGGDFLLLANAELSFPLYAESLRGVVFVDAGTVETNVEITTMRVAVGGGIRMVIPFLGQVPIAIDLAWPLIEDDKDETQVISFSLGISP